MLHGLGNSLWRLLFHIDAHLVILLELRKLISRMVSNINCTLQGPGLFVIARVKFVSIEATSPITSTAHASDIGLELKSRLIVICVVLWRRLTCDYQRSIPGLVVSFFDAIHCLLNLSSRACYNFEMGLVQHHAFASGKQ